MKHFFFYNAGVVLFAIALIVLTGFPREKNYVSAMQSQSVEQRVKNLHTLLDEHWEYVLRTSPEFASILGDKRFNDRLTDFSQAAIEQDIRQNRQFLEKFEAVDSTGFPEQEKLNRDLMVRNLREELEGVKFKEWQMPVSQF